MTSRKQAKDISAIRDHRRQWRDCLYVYPVISRRSGGLSIGVNLNPDKQCNFSCVYCQIDRYIRRGLKVVDLKKLRSELQAALEAAVRGELWAEPRFSTTPASMRRINDIAFSGDGEPTCLDNFDEAVQVAVDCKKHLGREEIKIVVITNASQFHRRAFQRALETLDKNNGEIWAKLDAGTEERFQRINRPDPKIPLQRILDNIAAVARTRPIVIQTLLFRLDGKSPPEEEIQAYCDRIREILQSGGQIKLIQLHTIARPPAEPCVEALKDAELDSIATKVRTAAPELLVETYYGFNAPPQQR